MKMHLRKFSLVFCWISCLIIVNSAQAATTRHVGSGQDYSTIQAGINAAGAGDTVLVHDGTYVENINFNGKAITVKSQNGPESTIIDGNSSGTVVAFSSGEGSGSVIDGFTIQNGLASSAGGVGSYQSSPIIMNCIIKNNRTTDLNGAGVALYYSSASISNCTITGNTAADDGGGIHISESSATVTGCTITGNSAGNGGGGIFIENNDTTTITNCTISGNTAREGGGINCDNTSPLISQCTINSNTATEESGGIHIKSGSNPVISNSLIQGNSSAGEGGIGICGGSPIITNCIITGNKGVYVGGIGVWDCDDPSVPVITNCVISGNSASEEGSFDGGGIVCGGSATPRVVNSIIWGNERAGSSNDVHIYAASSPTTIKYSDINPAFITGSGAPALSNNINSNPLFVNARPASEAPTTAGDYHIQSGSPCIDEGTSIGAPSDDIEGVNRPHGSAYDMGAYEYWGSCPIYVPDVFNSIQDAIDAAPDGCTIIVWNGTYTENINFRGKAITVKSENGADVTTIDGSSPTDPNKGSVVTFEQGEGAGSVLEGFTITGGSGNQFEYEGEFYQVGGGIYCYNSSSPMITNCITSGNEVEINGGGIFCINSSSPTITNCSITGNSVTSGSGGGIGCHDFSSPTITNCTISSNTAEGSAGGIDVGNGGTSSITDCTITNNTAAFEGGGIAAYGSAPTITNCTITGNSAAEGGGIVASDATPMITGCTISNNTATYGGGIGIWSTPSATIKNCTIKDNKAINNGNGGGIKIWESSPTITGCTITGNSAAEGGGFHVGEASSATIIGCIVSGNSTTLSSGGGMGCYNSSPTITNSVFSGNSASTVGGGMVCYNSSPVITNCTITGNLAEYGGGFWSSNLSSPNVINSILWGNIAGEYSNEIGLYSGGTINISYSDIQGSWDGTGNIYDNPSFVNARPASQAPTSEGDYHLQPGSPCIDAANSNSAYATDKDGKPRYDDPDTEPNTGVGTNGDYYDMGAYEYQYTCTSGETRSCNTDLPGTCATGTQSCGETGLWGDCVPNIQPGEQNEICDGVDNDCDGVIDTDECCVGSGDVNKDGSITPVDALWALKHSFGLDNPSLTECQQGRADVNNDGSITPSDALCIFQKYMGLSSCLDD